MDSQTYNRQVILHTIRQVWEGHEDVIREAMSCANDIEMLILRREQADAEWLRRELMRRLGLEEGTNGSSV